MSKGELFTVNIDGDAMYEAYQNAFPAGTNEVFRTAREHECSTCRSFIKNIGNVVSIKDGQIDTVWNVVFQDPLYMHVAVVMDNLIRSRFITGIFRKTEPSYGVQKNKELVDGVPRTWNHFHGKLASKHHAGGDAATQIGEANQAVQVFRRGMEEITPEAIERLRGPAIAL